MHNSTFETSLGDPSALSNVKNLSCDLYFRTFVVKNLRCGQRGTFSIAYGDIANFRLAALPTDRMQQPSSCDATDQRDHSLGESLDKSWPPLKRELVTCRESEEREAHQHLYISRNGLRFKRFANFHPFGPITVC